MKIWKRNMSSYYKNIFEHFNKSRKQSKSDTQIVQRNSGANISVQNNSEQLTRRLEKDNVKGQHKRDVKFQRKTNLDLINNFFLFTHYNDYSYYFYLTMEILMFYSLIIQNLNQNKFLLYCHEYKSLKITILFLISISLQDLLSLLIMLDSFLFYLWLSF